MNTLFRELQLQLQQAPVNVLNEGLFYLNTLVERNEPEYPFTSMDELLMYREMIWKEMHRRNFQECIEQIHQVVPELNAYNETSGMRYVTITIVDPPRDDDSDDGDTVDIFSITDHTNTLPNQRANTESSTISLSISESEIPQPQVDIIEKWLLYIRYENDFEKISAYKALARFNRTRKPMVEEWLLNFDKYEQDLPTPPPAMRRSNSCMF